MHKQMRVQAHILRWIVGRLSKLPRFLFHPRGHGFTRLPRLTTHGLGRVGALARGGVVELGSGRGKYTNLNVVDG